MTEKKLISLLQELKQIKPRKEWVSLSKMNILGHDVIERKEMVIPAQHASFSSIAGLFYQKKLAYTFAALAILAVASFGFLQYGLNGLEGNPTGPEVLVLSEEASLEAKTNVEAFKAKSHDLAQLAKENPESVSLAVNDVKAAAKQLTETIKKYPEVAKEVALEINNNKTYLDIQETSEEASELKVASNDLYKIVVEQMIEDLQKTSLTESQQDALDIAKDLHEKEKHTDALESILLLSMAIKNS